VPPWIDGEDGRRQLHSIEQALCGHGDDLVVYLVYDRPSLIQKRPGLARTYFEQRCVPERQLERMKQAFLAIGAEAVVVEGDRDFLATLLDGHHEQSTASLRVAYNGLAYNVGEGAFEPGRKALIPLLADSFGLTCANSGAYACTFTLHKFHSFTLLRSLGIDAPGTWMYRPESGWVGDMPPLGLKVIAKSNYESWAVGVNEDSVFVVDDACTERLSGISDRIGQPVTVQEYITGAEVYVPVLSCPELVATPPVLSVLKRAPGDNNAYVRLEDNLSDDAISYRPFEADTSVELRLRDTAREIYDLLELQGLGRIDFRVDSNGRPWVFDIAISPGLERGGSAAVSAAAYGFDYESFIRLVVASTLATRRLLGPQRHHSTAGSQNP
jgi:D-alanine-D-alanine ligase